MIADILITGHTLLNLSRQFSKALFERVHLIQQACQQAALVTKQIRAQNAKAAALILVNDASEPDDTLVPFKTLLQSSQSSMPIVLSR